MPPSVLSTTYVCHSIHHSIFKCTYEIISSIPFSPSLPPPTLPLSNSMLHGTEILILFVPTNISADLSSAWEHSRHSINIC